VSVPGASRLVPNSLLDLVVFGRRAGVSAAAHAADTPLPEVPEEPVRDTLAMLDGILRRTDGENAGTIREELQDSMFDNAFVVRTDEGLGEQEAILADLRARYDRVSIGDKGAVYNTDLMETVELGFLLDLAETLVVAARARTESRGGHYREDHPLRDDANWLRHSLAYRTPGGGVRLDYKPVKMGPYIPMERKY